MKTKLIGIFICMLLIATALPVTGELNKLKNGAICIENSNQNFFPHPTPLIKKWYKTFGGAGEDRGNYIQQTSDGGYIVAGWTDSFGAGSYDMWLIKTNADGDKIWDKTYGGSDDDSGGPLCAKQTSDGGYILSGRTKSFGAGNYDVWLIKTDADGDMIWDKTFGGEGADGSHSVLQIEDGYIIAGGTSSFGAGNYDVWLIKTDADGDMIWDKTYGGSSADWGCCVQQTDNGGYIIAGNTYSFGANNPLNVWLVKTDSNGNEIWNKTFGGNLMEYGYSVYCTVEGGYVLSGKTNSYGSGGDDAWLIKTDADGNEIWNKTFGGSNDESGNCVQQTTDGGYIVEGYTNSFGEGLYDNWLVKIDNEGNELWNRTFGGDDDDQGTCVQQTTDGGYIAVGYSKSFGEGDYDVLLMKTDSNGESYEISNPLAKIDKDIIRRSRGYL